MTSTLFFSIIIPTYNRASFIAKTIQSVLNQTYTNFEVIVVDDGSTDNTEKVVKSIKDERIKYYKKENAERGAARNCGIKLAKGDYITFLDSDDIFYDNHLANANHLLRKEDNSAFVHLAYEIKNEKGQLLDKFNKLKLNDKLIVVNGNPLSCIGVFIRKDITKHYKFNEDRQLSGSEDWELWIRIIANYGIVTSNKISACMIQHNTRSVLTADENKLLKRKELALFYSFQDEKVREIYTPYYSRMESFADSYIALHLALAGNSKLSFRYLIKSIYLYPQSIFSKRFLAIIKHLIIS